jgi:hypothetical protein
MNHQEYINELARQSAQKQASLNKKAAANIVKGFAQGGPVGAIVAGVKAAREKGKNLRNSAKEMDSAMLEQGKAANEELMNESDNQLAQNQQALQDVVNNSNIQGTMTGGASNVFNGNVQPNPIEDPISLYQDSLRQQGFNDDVVNGVRQGLNSGNKEIDQWIQQYNNGAGRENPINIPKTEEEIALARQGKFNLPAQEAQVEKLPDTSLINRFANGLADFQKGFQENRNTGFDPRNLQSNPDKGGMQRFGEFMGTTNRVLNNPAAQALVAAGATALSGGGVGDVINSAYKYGSQRAMSDAYRNVLAKNGINIPETVFGNLTNKDIDAIMAPELKKIYYNYLGNKTVKDQEINAKNAESRRIQAEASKTRADKYNGGGKGSTTAEPSGQYVIGETPNGRQVKVPVERVKEFKSNGGKIVG